MASMNTDNLATKDDVHVLKTELKTDMAELRKDMKQMKDSLNEGIDRVLTVLVNNDKRLTSMLTGHERRIGKLEKHAGFSA